MRVLASTFFIAICITSFAQQLSSKEIAKFEAAEAILSEELTGYNNDSLSFESRVAIIHNFIPKFVAILKEKNSYLYPFDKLQLLKVIAPDNSFRIFTWQLKEPLGTHKYYGALQKNDDKLALFPLFDYSDTMRVHVQETLSHDNWYGSAYYHCLKNEANGKPYYTLFGFDEADFVSNRKILEILTFDESGEPVFGAPLFSFIDSLGNLTTKNRLFLEYDDKASVKLNYDTEMEKIIYDHLVPPSESEKDAWFTYIPDGTYEGLEWKNDQWTWVEKIFHFSIGKPDSPPMPKPILDNRD